jgi:RNA 2',3'-cyclic 3'-phosphodiesterase
VASDRQRLFVALTLPSDVRAGLRRWSEAELAPVSDLRLVRPESLHVTLCFLGSRPVDEVDPIAAVCRGLGSLTAPDLTLAGAVWVPRRRPRVVAVELADEAGRLASLQATLATALAAGGFYEAEDRPFFGHVTAARVAGRSRPRAVPLAAPASIRFVAGVLTLYRSRLGSGPARYEALETVELADADG